MLPTEIYVHIFSYLSRNINYYLVCKRFYYLSIETFSTYGDAVKFLCRGKFLELKIMLETGNVDPSYGNYWLFQLAAANGYIDIFGHLLTYSDITPDVKSKCLSLAAGQNQADMVKLLLDSDINLYPAICEAAGTGDIQLTSDLLTRYNLSVSNDLCRLFCAPCRLQYYPMIDYLFGYINNNYHELLTGKFRSYLCSKLIKCPSLFEKVYPGSCLQYDQYEPDAIKKYLIKGDTNIIKILSRDNRVVKYIFDKRRLILKGGFYYPSSKRKINYEKNLSYLIEIIADALLDHGLSIKKLFFLACYVGSESLVDKLMPQIHSLNKGVGYCINGEHFNLANKILSSGGYIITSADLESNVCYLYEPSKDVFMITKTLIDKDLLKTYDLTQRFEFICYKCVYTILDVILKDTKSLGLLVQIGLIDPSANNNLMLEYAINRHDISLVNLLLNDERVSTSIDKYIMNRLIEFHKQYAKVETECINIDDSSADELLDNYQYFEYLYEEDEGYYNYRLNSRFH